MIIDAEGPKELDLVLEREVLHLGTVDSWDNEAFIDLAFQTFIN